MVTMMRQVNRDWIIVNKDGNTVVDELGNMKILKEKSIDKISFLVNRLGTVCEYTLEDNKIKYKDLSTEFYLVNSRGKSNIKNDLEMKVYNNEYKIVEVEKLDYELNIVTGDEIYKVYVENNEVVMDLLDGWKAELLGRAFNCSAR